MAGETLIEKSKKRYEQFVSDYTKQITQLKEQNKEISEVQIMMNLLEKIDNRCIFDERFISFVSEKFLQFFVKSFPKKTTFDQPETLVDVIQLVEFLDFLSEKKYVCFKENVEISVSKIACLDFFSEFVHRLNAIEIEKLLIFSIQQVFSEGFKIKDLDSLERLANDFYEIIFLICSTRYEFLDASVKASFKNALESIFLLKRGDFYKSEAFFILSKSEYLKFLRIHFDLHHLELYTFSGKLLFQRARASNDLEKQKNFLRDQICFFKFQNKVLLMLESDEAKALVKENENKIQTQLKLLNILSSGEHLITAYQLDKPSERFWTVFNRVKESISGDATELDVLVNLLDSKELLNGSIPEEFSKAIFSIVKAKLVELKNSDSEAHNQHFFRLAKKNELINFFKLLKKMQFKVVGARGEESFIVVLLDELKENALSEFILETIFNQCIPLCCMAKKQSNTSLFKIGRDYFKDYLELYLKLFSLNLLEKRPHEEIFIQLLILLKGIFSENVSSIIKQAKKINFDDQVLSSFSISQINLLGFLYGFLMEEAKKLGELDSEAQFIQMCLKILEAQSKNTNLDCSSISSDLDILRERLQSIRDDKNQRIIKILDADRKIDGVESISFSHADNVCTIICSYGLSKSKRKKIFGNAANQIAGEGKVIQIPLDYLHVCEDSKLEEIKKRLEGQLEVCKKNQAVQAVLTSTLNENPDPVSDCKLEENAKLLTSQSKPSSFPKKKNQTVKKKSFDVKIKKSKKIDFGVFGIYDSEQSKGCIRTLPKKHYYVCVDPKLELTKEETQELNHLFEGTRLVEHGSLGKQGFSLYQDFFDTEKKRFSGGLKTEKINDVNSGKYNEEDNLIRGKKAGHKHKSRFFGKEVSVVERINGKGMTVYEHLYMISLVRNTH